MIEGVYVGMNMHELEYNVMSMLFVIYSMDCSWIDIQDRLSVQYVKGVDEFISFARRCINSEGKMPCPCNFCLN